VPLDAVDAGEGAAPDADWLAGRGPADDVGAEEVLALHAALGRLEARDARQGRIVECRFFAGLSIPETAEALGISPATVKREWAAARAALYADLAASRPGG
jgi:DNA-directed RNA polymerase specialized sigma24 family protein